VPTHERTLDLDGIVDALQRRRPPQVVGEVPPDARDSAVLCLLYESEGEPHVVLTRRSPRMRLHAHEIAVPGGRKDDTDPDLWATAVREAEEEVALDAAGVERVGALDSFVTVGSRTLVTPYVAVADRPPLLTPSPDEVESIRRVSLRRTAGDHVLRAGGRHRVGRDRGDVAPAVGDRHRHRRPHPGRAGLSRRDVVHS
jgi:8-oxo-dGTP pyrophosphatase MutT (NUDIX family)